MHTIILAKMDISLYTGSTSNVLFEVEPVYARHERRMGFRARARFTLTR